MHILREITDINKKKVQKKFPFRGPGGGEDVGKVVKPNSVKIAKFLLWAQMQQKSQYGRCATC
jgi:hypothetical protein